MNLLQQPLLIGVWVGLIHAFDADHLSTLSNLAVRDRPRSALAYAARWACGHAVSLCALGALAIGVGMLWVSSLSHYAEMIVAGLLVALGVHTLVSAWTRRAVAPVAVLPVAGERAAVESTPTGRHATGLVMGLLHGGAGSAAVLALLPLAGFDSGFAAASFLLAFSLGVAGGALLFAAFFSGLMSRTVRGGARLALAVMSLVGAIAICVGGSMLLGTLNGG